MSEKGLQEATYVAAFVPVDMAAAANNGDWVSMANYRRCECILFKGAGVANDDPVFTMKQAKDNAGAGAKDLNFTVIHKKIGAQSGIADFARVTQTAAATHTDTASAEVESLMVVEIKDEELDVDGGFDFIQLSVPDVGAGGAQLGCALYRLFDARYPQATPPSAI